MTSHRSWRREGVNSAPTSAIRPSGTSKTGSPCELPLQQGRRVAPYATKSDKTSNKMQRLASTNTKVCWIIKICDTKTQVMDGTPENDRQGITSYFRSRVTCWKLVTLRYTDICLLYNWLTIVLVNAIIVGIHNLRAMTSMV